MSMKPDIKAKWVQWLRDNQDKQGTGWLRSQDNKYCCLGGLCELAVEAGIARRELDPLRSHRYYRYFDPQDRGDNSEIHLPDVVVRWAGVEDYSPSMPNYPRTPLTNMNDSGVSFLHIAAIIEDQL